jgi:hypothetical protein
MRLSRGPRQGCHSSGSAGGAAGWSQETQRLRRPDQPLGDRAAQVHLEKRLEDGRPRPHTLTEAQLHELSFETRKFSGAMLASLVNAGALAAGRAGREAVGYHDIANARPAGPRPPAAPPAGAACLPRRAEQADMPGPARAAGLDVCLLVRTERPVAAKGGSASRVGVYSFIRIYSFHFLVVGFSILAEA